jgi:predicted transcriptional regulator
VTNFDKWTGDLEWRARCAAQAQREHRRQIVCAAIVSLSMAIAVVFVICRADSSLLAHVVRAIGKL